MLTVNESGGVLLKICFSESQKCFWSLSAGPKCDGDATYPALINTESGAQSVELLCAPVEDTYLLAFQEYDAMQRLMDEKAVIGVAFPMKEGQFRVFRFSMKGSKALSEKLEEWALAASKSSTKDLTL